MKQEHPEVVFVAPDTIYSQDVDVFVPCALGAILNDTTIPQIKAKIIAGTANNALADEDKHGNMIRDLGILYAPDFVINAGGVINVYHELHEYNIDVVNKDVEKIYDRLLEIFAIADEQKINTQEAAKVYARNRIAMIQQIHANYIPR
jgi:leucine dehydrogenase